MGRIDFARENESISLVLIALSVFNCDNAIKIEHTDSKFQVVDSRRIINVN